MDPVLEHNLIEIGALELFRNSELQIIVVRANERGPVSTDGRECFLAH
jgi:hypothetical protein